MVLAESIQFFALLIFSFLMGLVHALEVDHVVTVSTIISETQSLKKSALISATWAIGHTTSLLLLGLLVLVFKFDLPENLTVYLELLAGLILILFGTQVIRKAISERIHAHSHPHGNEMHAHSHSHENSSRHNHLHKSFVVGLIHGLAGSGVIILLVLAAVKSPIQGIIYLLIFGMGSVFGMVLVGWLISLSFLLTKQSKNIHKKVKFAVGLISIVLGIVILLTVETSILFL